jgi:SpoIID/LytB domain protein
MTSTEAAKSEPYDREPVITVGIIDRTESVTVRLEGTYGLSNGRSVGPGELRVTCRNGRLWCDGALQGEVEELELEPEDLANCRFVLEAIIGIDFHWEQTETQAFRGGLRLAVRDKDHVTVINRVALEIYITSVICSEMNADSPVEAIRAHAVISRSWLLAQLDKKVSREKGVRTLLPGRPATNLRSVPSSEKKSPDPFFIRWTEREAHADYDVCADDHCQRYQGIGRTDSPEVKAAIAGTRGQVLLFAGQACDTRFSKCCGGVTEQYQTAWGDEAIPYLVALPDRPSPDHSLPALTEESSLREFLQNPPAAYCNCHDRSILGRVLNDYDLDTADFFRWQVRLEAAQAGRLVAEKLGIDLGRLVAMEPIERGPSGRLARLRLVGETGSLVVGKELEIRRALSPTHLYSSAFVVDPQGPADRPDAFLLTGAGWGHGVGLCQIGAAVMACQGIQAEDILRHYYPGTELVRCYE